MPARDAAASPTPDREIAQTRVFDGPRDLLWTLWTQPQHVAQWWGPTGFATTIERMDVRPGGRWDFVMHGPDGTDYRNEIVYVEVEPGERLVWDHGPYPPFRATVTFTARGDRTEVTIRNVFDSVELRERVVREFGAVEGQRQTFDRLEDQIADVRGGRLVLERQFGAPRALLWRAWTERDRFAAWWGPAGASSPVCEIDVRPGGSIRHCMRMPGMGDFWTAGVYREVVKP